MIVLIYKWLKKAVFCGTGPSLSWQNDRLEYTMALLKAFSTPASLPALHCFELSRSRWGRPGRRKSLPTAACLSRSQQVKSASRSSSLASSGQTPRLAARPCSAPPTGPPPCEKRLLFSAFPYVCPEPVLVNQSILNKHGSKGARFPHHVRPCPL